MALDKIGDAEWRSDQYIMKAKDGFITLGMYRQVGSMESEPLFISACNLPGSVASPPGLLEWEAKKWVEDSTEIWFIGLGLQPPGRTVQ